MSTPGSSFDIKTDDVNVEEIMRKIKENIAQKKAQGAYSKMDEELVRSTSAMREPDTFDCSPDIKQDLLSINKFWDIENKTYSISSHRKIMGPVLVKGRQMVSGEVKRYIDPTIFKQREFNAHTVHVLNTIIEQNQKSHEEINADIENRMNILRQETDGKVKAINRDLEEGMASRVEAQCAGLEGRIDKKFEDTIAAIKRDVSDNTWLVNLLENGGKDAELPHGRSMEFPGMNYLAFENRFRGPSSEIKARQQAFIDSFAGCKNVLDIGCGRGEFLELANENGISAIGIDLDADMVAHCRSKGLNAEKSDAMEYLNGVSDGSLDGVFMDQVVEHLEPGYMIDLLKLCYRKLAPGSHIVIETVNPLSFFSMANFYIDMTHRKPVHPETLMFLTEYAGFGNRELRFFSPLPPGMSLEKFQDTGSLGEQERKAFEVYNKNMEKLNNILFGAQDYAVICKK